MPQCLSADCWPSPRGLRGAVVAAGRWGKHWVEPTAGRGGRASEEGVTVGETYIFGVLAAVVEDGKDLDLFADSCQRADRRGREARRGKSRGRGFGSRKQRIGAGRSTTGQAGRAGRQKGGSGRSRQRDSTGYGAERYHCEGFGLFDLSRSLGLVQSESEEQHG